MNEKNEDFYPKSRGLLASMAMRSDHGFGIYDQDIQEKMIAKMELLYDSYVSGKTNEEMSKEFTYGERSLKQIREELTGEGFYKHKKPTIHKPFGKK